MPPMIATQILEYSTQGVEINHGIIRIYHYDMAMNATKNLGAHYQAILGKIYAEIISSMWGFFSLMLI